MRTLFVIVDRTGKEALAAQIGKNLLDVCHEIAFDRVVAADESGIAWGKRVAWAAATKTRRSLIVDPPDPELVRRGDKGEAALRELRYNSGRVVLMVLPTARDFSAVINNATRAFKANSPDYVGNEALNWQHCLLYEASLGLQSFAIIGKTAV